MPTRPRRGLANWLTQTGTPVFVLDDRRVVLVFNRGCEQFTQWSAADVIGRTCEYRISTDPADVATVTGCLCPPELPAAMRPVSADVELVRKDGESRACTVHFFLLPAAEDGERPHVLGIISERIARADRAADRRFELSRHAVELARRRTPAQLVAVSPAMQLVASRMALANSTAGAVHLHGERGAGREHLARLIHATAAGEPLPFMPLRCGTGTHFELQRTLKRLLESARAEDPAGTVYLDEVERLPRDLQVLVRENFDRPGVRWMSAAIVSLDRLGEDEFDPELKSRLLVVPIAVPPLRQRLADVPLLAQQLVEGFNRPQRPPLRGVAPAVERALLAYNWPGNVEELERVLHAASLRCAGGIIELTDLPFEFAAGQDAQQTRPVAAAASLEQQLDDFEREKIRAALSAARGNKSQAADQLGMPRAKLYRRMESLGLAAEAGDVEE